MKKRINSEKNNNNRKLLNFTVDKSCILLDFLLLRMSSKSRNHVKSLLKYRAVSVDGTVQTKFNMVLKEGQNVQINRTVPQEKAPENELDILYEDEELIAIYKPAGLLSIASDKEKEFTAYHMLTDYVKLKNPEDRIFVVHRLDRDTSGVLVVAKNEEIKLALQEHWSDLVLERAYYALVEGQLKEKKGKVHSWLKKTKTLMMYSSDRPGDGLEAITEYEVLEESEEYSLLDIHLQTGRKNQIRVHMKDLGHSVAGDKKYGAKTNPLKRLGLHAYKLSIKHPFTQEVMTFETPMPPRFKALLREPPLSAKGKSERQKK